jgi:hypothetical protein
MSGALHCRQCGVVSHESLEHRPGCLAVMARVLLATDEATLANERTLPLRRAVEALVLLRRRIPDGEDALHQGGGQG